MSNTENKPQSGTRKLLGVGLLGAACVVGCLSMPFVIASAAGLGVWAAAALQVNWPIVALATVLLLALAATAIRRARRAKGGGDAANCGCAGGQCKG